MSNNENKPGPESGTSLHIMEVTESRSDINQSSAVESTENHFCVQQCVNNTMKGDEPDLEYSNCEVVEIPSCPAFIPSEEAELTAAMVNIKLISELDHKRVEKEPQCECGVEDIQLESPMADDRNLEQFSEVLLDSDSSVSDRAVIADETVDNKKDEKRVRFADEVGTTEAIQGR